MRAKRTSPKKEEKKFSFKAKAFGTYHPRAVLLGGFELEDKIIADFARFNKKQLQRARVGLPAPGSKRIGYDTEYLPDGGLLTIGVGTPNEAAAFEVSDKAGIQKAKRVIKHAQTLIGHSVTGDLDQLVKLGLAKETWLKGIEVRDSFLLARMVDENRGKGGYGLEALLLSEFNSTGWKQETEKLLKQTGNAADWSPEQRTSRCRLDAWATAVLAEYFEQRLQRPKKEG